MEERSRAPVYMGCCLVGRLLRVSSIEPTLETEPERLRDAARSRVFAAGVDSGGCIWLRSLRGKKQTNKICVQMRIVKEIAYHSHQHCDSDHDEGPAGCRDNTSTAATAIKATATSASSEATYKIHTAKRSTLRRLPRPEISLSMLVGK